MAFTVRLGNVSKRMNSTAVPDTSAWLSASVTFKNAKDIDNPTFVLNLDTLAEYPNYNYMYLVDVGNYYWITSIVSVRANVWEITAVMDVLATYKTSILATSCFVEYGFNTDASGATYRLQDTRQNISQVPTISTVSDNFLVGKINTSTGCFCLTAVGASGGVSAYIISANFMKTLLDAVSTDINDAFEAWDWEDPATFTEPLKFLSINSLMQGNAISAIRSCVWLPVYLTTFADVGTTQTIYLGDFNTGVTGLQVKANVVVVEESTINIPWPTDDWKRMNCQLQLYVPFIGTVTLPVEQCNNASTVTIRWCLEPLGGTVSVRIDCGDYTAYIGSATIASSYAIGSSNVPIQNIASGAAQAIGGAIQIGGSAGSALANTVSPIDDIVGTGGISAAILGQGVTNVVSGVAQTITPIVQCAGTMTGASSCGQSMNIELTVFYYPPIDDAGFQALYGHPVMRVTTPAAGYCKTRGFSMANSAARGSELTTISRMMDAGVFIE